MIILAEQRLWSDIEEYCKVLDGIVTMPLKPEQKYSISQENLLSKKEYVERKEEIQNYIFSLLDKVNAVDKLCIALFIFRSIMKRKMYEDGFDNWTIQFKICNLLFYISLKYIYINKYERTLYIASNDRLFIKKIFIAGYTILDNQILFNEQYFKEYKEDTDKFFNRVEQVSNKRGDLHSYQITNSNLKKYLDLKGINSAKIKGDALSQYNEEYFNVSQLVNNASWKKMTSDNKSYRSDDIIIVTTYNFNRYDERLQNFITNFEAQKCLNPYDPESELIFAYRTDNYVYISKKLLNDTQSFIEACISWGQYGNITNYFFGKPINQKTLGTYNRLMTYKIADLLLTNGYILPMEIINGLFANYAQTECQFRYCGTAIPFLTVRSTAR